MGFNFKGTLLFDKRIQKQFPVTFISKSILCLRFFQHAKVRATFWMVQIAIHMEYYVSKWNLYHLKSLKNQE